MIPTNKPEFIEYCLRKLGKPVNKINIDPAQVDDRVSEALYRFYEHHYLAVETIWAIFTPTRGDAHKGYVLLPPDIIGVSDVFHASNTSNIYSIDFLMRLGELQALSKTQYAGINYYYTVKMHLELLNQMFLPEFQYDFNALSNKLIMPGMKELHEIEGVFAMRCYRKLADETDAGTNDIPVNIWKDRWLQNYTTALLLQQWAVNLSKMNGVAMLGGTTMNGETMYARAEANLEKLEQQLIEDYSPPPIGFMG